MWNRGPHKERLPKYKMRKMCQKLSPQGTLVHQTTKYHMTGSEDKRIENLLGVHGKVLENI